jgi:hypothetical protein
MTATMVSAMISSFVLVLQAIGFRCVSRSLSTLELRELIIMISLLTKFTSPA